MPDSIPVYKIFLSSPGDVPIERNDAEAVVSEINASGEFSRHFLLKLYRWDDPSVALPMPVTDIPQQSVDIYMTKPSECDLVIVLFWSRIGSPLTMDGRDYLSGTHYEYSDAIKGFNANGSPVVWLYRCLEEPSIKANDRNAEKKLQQYRSVEKFFDQFKDDERYTGGVNPYNKHENFKELFRKQLLHHLRYIRDTPTTKPHVHAHEQTLSINLQNIDVPNYEVFISYSSKNVEIAKELTEQLRNRGFNVMRDHEFLQGGQKWDQEIEVRVRRSPVMILLWSESASKSRWVKNEWMLALSLNKHLIPVMIEPNLELPFGLLDLQAVSLHGTNGLSGLNKLVSELIQFVPSHQTQEAEIPSEIDQKNPFIVGPRVISERFVGRKEVLHQIAQRVGGEQLMSISIVGNRRMGKSSLLHYFSQHYAEMLDQSQNWTVIYIDMMMANAITPTSMMRTLRRRIQKQLSEDYHDLLWEESQDGEVDMMAQTFEEFADEGINLVLCLDEFENVLSYQEMDQFIDTLRGAGSVSEIAMVTSTGYTLSDLIIAGKLTSPFNGIFRTSWLGRMPIEEWQELVRSAFQRGNRTISDKHIDLIGGLANGHPYLTQMAGSLIWNARDNGWTDNEIRKRFVDESTDYYVDMLHREVVSRQNDTLRHLLGLPTHSELAKEDIINARTYLSYRGIINQDGELFTDVFADVAQRILRESET